MKSTIQDLITRGNHNEIQKILTNQQLEISKSDIDKLIAIAEYTGQGDIVGVLQKIANSLIKDEGTQYDSLNTTVDTDKEYSKSIKPKLAHNNDVSKNSNFIQIKEWINTLKTIENKNTYEHILTSVQEIYTKQLSYTNTVNEICKEVKEIKQNQLLFDSLFNLSEAMAGLNKTINSNYKFSREDDPEIDVAGDVYDFTIKHID